ncbi:MAG TPA: hypothetical protein VMK31_06935 [Sphingomicrobium sp.]|nr:hypothetical protein [Sphingomicrobium sp.]
MATTAERQTPAHLWIIGLIALLWSGYGCYDYLMTMTANPAHMESLPADQIAYMESLPGWLSAFWALGVWGGLAGAVLLLIKSRYSVWAFGVSLIGAVIGLGYQIFVAEMPASMKEGAMAFLPWAIIIFAAFLFFYSRNMDKKGVLG